MKWFDAKSEGKFGGSEDLVPRQKLIWQEKNGASTKLRVYYKFRSDKNTKTTSLYYEHNVGFVHRNWYEMDGITHTQTEGGTERQRDGYTS